MTEKRSREEDKVEEEKGGGGEVELQLTLTPGLFKVISGLCLLANTCNC
jgi:hypothetical protein